MLRAVGGCSRGLVASAFSPWQVRSAASGLDRRTASLRRVCSMSANGISHKDVSHASRAPPICTSVASTCSSAPIGIPVRRWRAGKTLMASKTLPLPAPPQGAAAASCYTPFRLSGEAAEQDWVQHLELDAACAMADADVGEPLRVLVLYGSLRQRSYSKLLAYEFSRILERLGADVRVYDPAGLPVKDEASVEHPKVAEVRGLSMWSEAQVWVCPEQHGSMSGVFKNQIDWIPLSLGSVRPTQGRTVAVAQVNGGSQSFNVVNSLRVLGRWMRMIVVPNQSSVPKAWTEFQDDSRMKASSYRDRVVDVAEELLKFSLLLRGHASFLVDRHSERQEKRERGRLLSQAEKEALKVKDVAAQG